MTLYLNLHQNPKLARSRCLGTDKRSITPFRLFSQITEVKKKSQIITNVSLLGLTAEEEETL